MSECKHGSLERQCATCEALRERDRAIALAFLEGVSVGQLAAGMGLPAAEIQDAIRRVCVLGGQG